MTPPLYKIYKKNRLFFREASLIARFFSEPTQFTHIHTTFHLFHICVFVSLLVIFLSQPNTQPYPHLSSICFLGANQFGWQKIDLGKKWILFFSNQQTDTHMYLPSIFLTSSVGKRGSWAYT